MGNLDGILPQDSETVQAIYAYHKQRGDSEPARGYLGASILGHHCDRFLWYTFRGLVKRSFDGRLYRLFETGDLAEGRFVTELRAIGAEVLDVDEDGEQFAVHFAQGHGSGHMDAQITGLPEAPSKKHVGEFKTHNRKSFEALKRDGVEKSKPQHYAQMQVYMGLTPARRALYLAVNKDTDELYSERVHFDKAVFDSLMKRAERIVFAPTPPLAAYKGADFYLCKWCDARELCWGLSATEVLPIPERTCRSCSFVTPSTNGRWICEQYDQAVDTEVGGECPAHVTIPDLLLASNMVEKAVDYKDGLVTFQLYSGERFDHGNGPGAWSTDELMCSLPTGRKLPMALEGGDPDKLTDAYPWGDSGRLWDGPQSELGAALAEHVGMPPELLNKLEPKRSQVDGEVNAAEYWLNDGHYLVVSYLKDKWAAIWKGKE